MKNLMVSLSVLFIFGCASNGGILDAVFWAKNYNAVKDYVIDKVVPEKVVTTVDSVIYHVTTPLDVKKAECKEKGGTMGSSEVCRF